MSKYALFGEPPEYQLCSTRDMPNQNQIDFALNQGLQNLYTTHLRQQMATYNTCEVCGISTPERDIHICQGGTKMTMHSMLCPMCGGVVKIGQTHDCPNSFHKRTQNLVVDTQGHMMGWECPKCHAVMGPSIPSCINCLGEKK